MLVVPVFAAWAAGGGSDQNFVEEAAQGGIAEVELGKIAVQNAKTEPVRTFGQQMVTDHEKSNQKLKTIASTKGLRVPTETDVMHKAAKKRMEGMTGPDFDAAYVKSQVADHEKMVKLMQQQSQDGKDPELKAFAAETLPVVQRHLEMVKALQQGGDASHSKH